MLKARLGAVPVVDVNTPPTLVIRSSQCAKIVGPAMPAVGRQSFEYAAFPPERNCAFPLLLTTTCVYCVPYSVQLNGSATVESTSSPWLPVSVVPGIIVPVVCVMAYPMHWALADGALASSAI